MSLHRLWQWLRPSGAIFLAACVVAQGAPLLDVLGYEYATLVGVLVSVVGTFRALASFGRLDRSLGGCRWKMAARASVDLLGLVALAGLISAVNMLRVRNCEPGVGLAYLLVFGVGAVPMAVATGLVAAHARGAFVRAGIVVGLLLASFASTLATLALQPAIVAYDTYLGYYAGSIYDESLVGFAVHVVYRVWGVAVAVGVVALCEAARRGWRRERWIVGACAAIVVVLFAFRGPIGLERDRGYVTRALGGHVQTEHFDIYYEAAAFDGRRLELLIADHEARYAELAEFWGVEPPHRLRSFVYGSRDTKGALMGGRRTLVAKIWLGEMHITWDGIGDELLAHEMAHLFLRQDGYGPLKLSSGDGLLPIMALVEGSATAAAWGASELDYHHWSAAIYRLELGEDISDLLGPAGFWGRYSRLAYTLTGSFVRWLVDTRGPERFRSAYQRGDFETAYGESLADLLQEWRGFLDALELSDQQLEAARYRYDRPSLFGRLCARSIATRFDEGEAFVARGERERAARCFEGILADDPNNVGYRLRIARTYAAMGENEAARRHAEWIAEREEAGRASRDRARELVADLDWRAGRAAAAEAALADLLAGAGTEGDRRRLQAKLSALAGRVEAPLTERAVRNYLAAGGDVAATSVVAELTFAWVRERAPLAGYLALLRIAASDTPDFLESFANEVDRAALTPAQQRRLVSAIALHHTERGEAEAACAAWSDVSALATVGSAAAATAEMWLGRCRRGTMPPPDTSP